MTTSRRPLVGLAALALSAGLACSPALLIVSPAAAATSYADLRADSNRDGTVDLTGVSDDSIEETARALVLPNLDDDAARCPKASKANYEFVENPKTTKLLAKVAKAEKAGKTPPKTKPTDFPAPTEKQLAEYYQFDINMDRCNDAADETVNGDVDAADLATVQIAPQPGIPAGSTGSITLSSDKFRVFLAGPGGWQLVTPELRVSADQLRAGVRLGVEAKDIARDVAVWDGTGQLTLTVTTPAVGSTPAGSSTDTVKLSVAPLLVHHHLQRAQQMLSFESRSNKEQLKFNNDLRAGAKAAGVDGGLIGMKAPENWQQDMQEPAYVSMPTASGVQGMRLLVRSDQIRPGQRELYNLRGPGVGVVWLGRPSGEDSTYDSMGNLETIPPYTYGGRSYPAGRIVLGEDPGKLSPQARPQTMWAAQGQIDGGVQQPLMLDTGWLGVGHVDEIVSFVPADTSRGWKLVLADPMAGIDLLRKAKAAGHGADVISSMDPKITVDVALQPGRKGALDVNKFAAKKIAANLDRIKAATGLTDAEVVYVPTLHLGTYQKNGSVRDVGALVPDAVNSPMVNGYVLAPKQHSVVVNGRDIFADAVTKAYAKAGMKTHFVEDLLTQHAGGGEVHCGSNTLRDISQPWWK